MPPRAAIAAVEDRILAYGIEQEETQGLRAAVAALAGIVPAAIGIAFIPRQPARAVPAWRAAA